MINSNFPATEKIKCTTIQDHFNVDEGKSQKNNYSILQIQKFYKNDYFKLTTLSFSSL